VKGLKIIALSIGAIFALVFTGLVVVASFGPDTYVYLGKQLPKRYADKVHALGLIDADEKIKYFYSDALVSIEDGMYFVTDRNLVLYSRDWQEPKTVIHFRDIVNLEAEYDDSVLSDSMVYVKTVSGMEVSFPVSSEHGRDKDFVRYLRLKSRHDGEARSPG